MKSAIRYFGGKGTLYNKILKYFPSQYDIYIEPFGGAYSVGLQQKCRQEIYNDLEKNVYSLFKVISDKELFKQFKEKCDLLYYSEDLRKEFKQELKLNNNLSIIDRAFYFFYVSRTSVNGVGGFSINLIKRHNMSKSVSDLLSTIDNLEMLHNRLSTIIVCNQDGTELIKKYNKSNVFFYLDPPYMWSTRGTARYSVDMNLEQQELLIDTVLDCKESKFLISGYNNDLYKKLEENGFKRIEFESSSLNNQGGRNIESLWYNYESIYDLKEKQQNKCLIV